jgi:hypothetical protein
LKICVSVQAFLVAMQQIRQDAVNESVKVAEVLNEILPAAFAARRDVEKALQLPLEKACCAIYDVYNASQLFLLITNMLKTKMLM